MTHLSDEATVSEQTGRPYSPNTINRMATSVRRIIREAGQQGYLDPESVKGFHAVEGANRKALKGRLRPHNRVKITREQMREIADLAKTEAARLVRLRTSALLPPPPHSVLAFIPLPP